MKKIILSAIVAVCAISADAQTWAGGSVGFNVRDIEGAPETQMDLTIAPEIGYSLNEKWDVAAAVKFGTISNRNGIKDNNVTTFEIQPYARYTFAEAGIAKFFVDGYFGFGSYKPKGFDATTTFALGVRPGVKVALADDVCLVSTLGNLGYKNVKDNYSEFGFNVDATTINFGIYFNF
jgi:hypothetical protein